MSSGSVHNATRWRRRKRTAARGPLLDNVLVFQDRNGKKSVSLEAAVEAPQARERFEALDLDRQRGIIRLLLKSCVDPATRGVRPTKNTARQRVRIAPLDPRTGEELPGYNDGIGQSS